MQLLYLALIQVGFLVGGYLIVTIIDRLSRGREEADR